MGKKIYVGNLPYSLSDQSLAEVFSECGNVQSARIIMDRDSGRRKGFAFVEMTTDDEAASAISKLNGYELSGRALNVSEAKPMAPRNADRNADRNGGGQRPRF